ncbi:hypothetical protein NPS29_00290 [Pseudomonas putida]|uniref:GapS6b family protein n=1 Tax=Pseudomonas putida TaxID=303 RepID=UPI0023643F97|nr:hypothetical protein [Pseudomonas putida]MDD1963749.1 hypothetical protein [Pseudomonas putida]
MTAIEQHHSGTGDNVRDKYFVTITTLAPETLLRPLEMVFESLRRQDRETAKNLLNLLKSIPHQDPASQALLDGVAIYGELIEPQDQDAAWGTLFRIVSKTKDPVVKDVCLAAILRLAAKTNRAPEACKYYSAETEPGIYAKEAFLTFFADAEQLHDASESFVVSEEELTGIVEGAIRLDLTGLAVRVADQLVELYPGYNAKVLRTTVTALELNPELKERHLWLCTPSVKQKLDNLASDVVGLLEQSKGTDQRLYNMACPILDSYQGAPPQSLLDTLQKYKVFLGPAHVSTAAQLRALAGDESALLQWQAELYSARENPVTRQAWCAKFLASNNPAIEQVMPFIHLADPQAITSWLSGNPVISDLSQMEIEFIRLYASAFRAAMQTEDRARRSELAAQVHDFSNVWGYLIDEISPARIFELAEKLFEAKLPDKALLLTSAVIGCEALWVSNFVVTHLKCLVEAQQLVTFDEVLRRVADSELSISVLNFCSFRDERLGDTVSALAMSEQMITLAPDLAYCWYRGCYLRHRNSSPEEQRLFHARIPDTLLQNHSRESAAILFFVTLIGDFRRAETRWVDWFIQDPLGKSIDFVDFYLGAIKSGRAEIEFSASLPQCLGAVQFTQDGVRQTRLIVEDYLDVSECTLKASSQLGQRLLGSADGDAFDLGMITYVVEEHLPPYLACLRMATQIRHKHNDGSDSFVIMRMPSDLTELVPFLEQKLSKGHEGRSRLRTIDDIPLFMRGHGLSPDNPLKAAFNCWADAGIPKSLLHARGEEAPGEVILDAYSISYLAVTDLVQKMLDIGVSFILPSVTWEALQDWIEQISDSNYMTMGVDGAGKFYRTTASDIHARDGHILAALNLVLANASVIHPGPSDAALEVFSIRGGVDQTVYEAMQLSSERKIPWLCMDAVFAGLHESKGRPVVDAYGVIARAMASAPFAFDHKRHAFLLFAVGALPLPITYSELRHLARTPDNLAGFILFKIIQNHGRVIFLANEQPGFLLELILTHIGGRFVWKGTNEPIRQRYSPPISYTSHVFNHGIEMFLKAGGVEPVEYRLAVAISFLCTPFSDAESLLKDIVSHFMEFAKGRFLDVDQVRNHLMQITAAPPLQSEVNPPSEAGLDIDAVNTAASGSADGDS